MIKKILENYKIPGSLKSIKEYNVGNINKTYIIEYDNEGKTEKYLVQKINTLVFNNPYLLMDNIEKVTNYLKNKMIEYDDKEHKVINIIKTTKDESLCKITDDKNVCYFRIYNFIDNSISYNNSTDNRIVYNTGKAFGNFNKLLNNYPINTLEETIKDFHNTEKRLENFLNDIESNSFKRVNNVKKEINEILKRSKLCNKITKELSNGNIPYRVTHNDTKVNNVLMNKETGDYLAVIDLDTVMPGSLLYDYGDGIRSTSSTALEDEKDLSKVSIDLKMFENYTDGYMSEMFDCITENEIALMGESIRIITLELAMRFLNDYINGDVYFKTDYENHNLDRARNQLALVKDIEKKLPYINNYIYLSYEKYQKNNFTLKKVVKHKIV